MTELVLAEYGDVCHLCFGYGATTTDHLKPRARGGDDSLDNLRPAHGSCNSKRGAMPLREWFKRYPPAKTTTKPSRKW